jgi:uridine phosphorylase
MVAGDLFSASEAYCGEGASQYYTPGETKVSATLDVREWISSEALKSVKLHHGCIYTTSALFAEGADDIENWYRSGCSAVDLETAATFAVAKYFGMDRGSIAYAFDNQDRRNTFCFSESAG